VKVAVTAVLAVRARVQVEVPEQAPDQPAKVEPVPGVAVRVTLVPLEKEALHVEPQLIPLGLLVTVPVPARETLSTGDEAPVLKLAVAEASALRVSVQVVVPEQPPDQPAKVEPAAGVAVRVMVVPPLKLALQVAPQLIPEGTLVIVPEPVPLACTVSWKVEPDEEELILPPPQPVARTAAVRQPQAKRTRRTRSKPTCIERLTSLGKRSFDD
jgi:hypothetical protein